ncbi:unnamed protein product [Mytilus coruscus]|uniref:Uncharacterized protein n=1 Tax=Mytilus coruscus TaxID=42192 RepID=A0A6J8C4J4_MYTCO|nr:unnamed protein product [Mytilus coruscus]
MFSHSYCKSSEQSTGLTRSRTHKGILYTHNDHGDGPNIYAIDSATGRNGTAVAVVNSNQIDQTSGICASRSHPGYLYTHNDHGDGSHIYVLDSKTGHRVSTITIRGAHNADWEDIACGPCPRGGNCIYIGKFIAVILVLAKLCDIGNDGTKHTNVLYRIQEPVSIDHNGHADIDAQLHFSWNESDCETLLVDPKGEVYIISRASGIEVHPKIAHVPMTGWNSHVTVVLKDLVNLNIPLTGNDPTGGDISPNGKEALIIAHNAMYHFEIPDGMVLLALSASNPIAVPYIQEPKGEAVSWDNHGNGYFTLGEGHDQTLYYYGRNTDIVG